MQQIMDWLKQIGMHEYIQHFAENDIDFAILSDLTDQDLEKIGVRSLGHRRKLLRAIATLKDVEKSTPAAALAAALPATSRATDAERRQVTVLFSDLVGSTALSARMDPEDLREVISAYQKCVSAAVHRLGGFVAKYLGDGVLVYFGYPEAHEDDAERAVRAGLELVAAVAGLKKGASLQTRVGIATGLVVVGDLIGSGEAQQRGIVGQTPNLAARLQGIAEPNTVVIAEGTRRLLGNLFELEDLGAKDLKGITDPVRVWAALRASAVESRFEALHASGLTVLIGREEETELLLRRWSRAKNGEGQVVLLSGEAGIGKSRLIAALLEGVAREPHIRLRYFCSPQHTDSASYPMIGQLERAAGLLHDDTTQQKLDKLDALLAQTSTSIQDAALFAELLSLSNDGRYPAFELTPQQRRQKMLEALTAQIEALSRQNPVLMIFEDAHWADPTSLEAFGLVIDRIRTLRVLLLITFRPEFDAPWVGRPYVTALTINRLTERDVSVLIDSIVGNKRLPAGIHQDIIERTDGIPLFVEEMTKAVVETEAERSTEHATSAVRSSALSVPPSLHASLMARLDRLGPAKQVAQIGAAIGREFSHLLLAAVARQPEPDLQGALDRLAAAGVLFQRGTPPHATYLFKHALVQDAAYSTLLREPRRALHARIVDTLEREFADVAENQPELLARHCTEAGLVEKAVSYWLKAGQLFGARSANAESVSHLTKALALLKDWPDSADRDRQELEVQVTLGPALVATRGYASDETVQCYERCRDLIEKTAGQSHWDIVLTGLSVTYYNRGDYRRCGAVGHELLRKAELARSSVAMCVGRRMIAAASNALGDFRDAMINGEMAFRHYDRDEHPRLAWRYVHDGGVAAASHWAIAAWHQGLIDTADVAHKEALSIAARLNHHNTTGYALYFNGVLPGFFRRDFAALTDYAARLLEHASRYHLPQWMTFSYALEGAARAHFGKVHDGILAIERGLAECEKIKIRTMRPVFLAGLSEAYILAGCFTEAEKALENALAIAERNEERWMNAELWRLHGALALTSKGTTAAAEAEQYFRRGIDVANAQGSRTFALRLAICIARLWADQGRIDDARESVAGALSQIVGGRSTPDPMEGYEFLGGPI